MDIVRLLSDAGADMNVADRSRFGLGGTGLGFRVWVCTAVDKGFFQGFVRLFMGSVKGFQRVAVQKLRLGFGV